MRAKPPFGYRQTSAAERHTGIMMCQRCPESYQPNVRLICGLTGAVVGRRKTCSKQSGAKMIGGVK